MNLVRNLVLVILLSAVAISATGQGTTDSQLAAHYYQSGEFDKAAMYYKRLYQSDPTLFNYNYYLKTLEKIEDFDEARKLIKSHQKIDFINQKVRVDYGRLYNLEGKPAKAKKEFDKLIKAMPQNFGAVKELAEAFEVYFLHHG